MQAFKNHLRNKYFWPFLFLVFISISLVIYAALFSLLDNSSCQHYNHTEKLNGG